MASLWRLEYGIQASALAHPLSLERGEREAAVYFFPEAGEHLAEVDHGNRQLSNERGASGCRVPAAAGTAARDQPAAATAR